jgi:hypothetical protein
VIVYTPCTPEHGIADDAVQQQARLAVDSRAFPLFTYDPRRGDTLAERLSLQGNPALRDDWSTSPDGTAVDFVTFARSEGRFAPPFRDRWSAQRRDHGDEQRAAGQLAHAAGAGRHRTGAGLNRGLLNWGVFLIAIGVVPLAAQLQIVDAGVAREVLRLWPLILIAVGIGLMLRITALAPLGGLVIAATLGLLLGALLTGGAGAVAGACVGTDRGGGEQASQTGSFVGDRARLDLELSCVELEMSRQPGQEWSVQATLRANRPPLIEASADTLRLRSAEGGGFELFGGAPRQDWRVEMGQQPALDVGLTLNASHARIALNEGSLGSTNATFNASDVRLDMGAATTDPSSSLNSTLNASSATIVLPQSGLTGSLSLNAASLTLCAAPDVGLQLNHRGTLDSENFSAAGLLRSGETWQTDGYSAAARKIELRLSSNLSSLTLDRSGDCP